MKLRIAKLIPCAGNRWNEFSALRIIFEIGTLVATTDINVCNDLTKFCHSDRFDYGFRFWLNAQFVLLTSFMFVEGIKTKRFDF